MIDSVGRGTSFMSGHGLFLWSLVDDGVVC